MNSIVSQINNPAWWFTTIIVALFVSLLAGFLKDWLYSWLGKHVRAYRLKRYRGLRKKVRFIRALRLSPHMYYAYGWMLQLELALTFFLILASIALPVTHSFFEENTVYDPLRSLGFAPNLPPYVIGVGSVFLLFLVMVRMFRLPAKARIFAQVYKKERRAALVASGANKALHRTSR
jgi:hypothetical protein